MGYTVSGNTVFFDSLTIVISGGAAIVDFNISVLSGKTEVVFIKGYQKYYNN